MRTFREHRRLGLPVFASDDPFDLIGVRIVKIKQVEIGVIADSGTRNKRRTRGIQFLDPFESGIVHRAETAFIAASTQGRFLSRS